jgi:hypothetical protein
MVGIVLKQRCAMAISAAWLLVLPAAALLSARRVSIGLSRGLSLSL